MTITRELISFENFTSKGEKYVILGTDLESILSPQKYKVLFYVEHRNSKNESLLTDFTNWIALPSPTIEIKPSENFISLRPGESKEIILNITLTQGYELDVSLSFGNFSDIIPSTNLHNFTVSTSGVMPVPISISVQENSTPKTITLPIEANASFVFIPPVGDPFGSIF